MAPFIGTGWACVHTEHIIGAWSPVALVGLEKQSSYPCLCAKESGTPGKQVSMADSSNWWPGALREDSAIIAVT